MKKLLMILLSFTLAISAFAGGNRASSSAAAPAASSGSGRRYTTLPYSDKKTTFTVFNTIGAPVTTLDYPANTYTKKVVDDTGIMLEFITASGADGSTRLNLLLNSGDYPDLIIPSNINWNDMNFYAREGIFIPLDDYHTLEYPNIAAAFKEFPALNDTLRGSDGKLYGLPDVNECIQCTYSNGRSWYYMPWVRDNNQKKPETLDDMLTYLRWIRDNDVNKNGNKNDEIPLVGELGTTISYFAHAYLPWTGSGLAVYNGTVTEQYKLNEFREVLKYIANLHKEGLLKEDAFTMTTEQLQALTRNPTPIVGVLTHAWPHDIIGSSSQRFMETFPLPMLKGPTGQRYGSNENPKTVGGSKMYITNKAKNPELAVALYDYMLNWEINNEDYGPRGLGWDYADQGAPNLIGGPALYKFLISRNDQAENWGWAQTNPGIRNASFRSAQQAANGAVVVQYLNTGDASLLPKFLGDPDYLEIMFNYTPMQINQGITVPETYFLPSPFRPNDADSTRISDINAVLNPYKNQSYAEFITGIRDINNNTVWNQYLAELDRIGSKELVGIYQKYVK